MKSAATQHNTKNHRGEGEDESIVQSKNVRFRAVPSVAAGGYKVELMEDDSDGNGGGSSLAIERLAFWHVTV